MNPINFFSLASLAIAAGTVAFVVQSVLMAPKMILNPYARWLSRTFGPEARARGRERQWLFKPLGGCLLCFAGQAGLWGYLFSLRPVVGSFWVHLPDLPGQVARFPVPYLAGFHAGHLAFTVCLSILTAGLLSKTRI